MPPKDSIFVRMLPLEDTQKKRVVNAKVRIFVQTHTGRLSHSWWASIGFQAGLSYVTGFFVAVVDFDEPEPLSVQCLF